MRLPSGFQYSGVRCGLKNKRNDVGWIVADEICVSGGVFTTNAVRAACVDHSRRMVKNGLKAIVVNSGNANCCTGEQGERDVQRTAEIVALQLGVSYENIAVASTGVIGVPLDMIKLDRGLAMSPAALSDDPKAFKEAILTTDLVEKEAYATAGEAALYGSCKGSGMIAPNMATMLGFIVTDAILTAEFAQRAVKTACDLSFNCMTVDTDTSTNDMVFLMASGKHRVDETVFQTSLNELCLNLAKQVARDGEGATKLIEVRVTGSARPEVIARSIADSPLVKTAMFGCDPNWGRIMMAAGKCGVPFSPGDSVLRLLIENASFKLFENGQPTKFDAAEVSKALKHDHVQIDLNLGEGPTATIYTCDLGYGYVRINAEYTT